MPLGNTWKVYGLRKDRHFYLPIVMPLGNTWKVYGLRKDRVHALGKYLKGIWTSKGYSTRPWRIPGRYMDFERIEYTPLGNTWKVYGLRKDIVHALGEYLEGIWTSKG